jgi:demethylmenaquinone methyltransferase/2-methoxy-6-polyprenyl-1,4-benzoquinol methylase
MFARIATRYDLANRVLSAGIDQWWRAKMVRLAVQNQPARVLDLATGSGDLALAIKARRPEATVVGADFCAPMLAQARRKGLAEVVVADALQLPFGDASFDVVTIAFGLRNLASVESGLAELLKVLKPGGWMAVLEFSRPANAILRPLFNLYFRRVLPWMGGVISGSRSAYTYLPASVQGFPDQSQLSFLMEQAGFDQVCFENLTGGIAALHIGRRPIGT